MQEHVGRGLPDRELVQHDGRHQAQSVDDRPPNGAGASAVIRNIAAFAPINAFNVMESGPGPKEKDEA